jgi:hypothetical protein
VVIQLTGESFTIGLRRPRPDPDEGGGGLKFDRHSDEDIVMLSRSWTILITLAIIATSGSESVSRGGDPPSSSGNKIAEDAVRTALLKKGYTAVPLIPGDDTESRYRVKCQCGSETVVFLIDTGSSVSVLDPGIAKTLKLESAGRTEYRTLTGKADAEQVMLRGMQIGEFDTRKMISSLTVVSFDLSGGTQPAERQKRPQFQGILGQQALSVCTAVIDYSTHTLYLRHPLRALWPLIEGKWSATGGEESGQRYPVDLKSPPLLHFMDDQMLLTLGEKKHQWGLHPVPDGKHYRLALFDPKSELKDELTYSAGGLLRVTDDKIKVCLILDPAKAKAFPTEFAAPKGSGLLLLEFDRVKAEKK